jgi:hypothetical protein
MSVSSYALVTLDEVKDYLALGASDVAKDTWLEQQIDIVSATIEGHCNRKFAVQSITSEIRDGNGRSKLRPLYYPIVQLSIATTPVNADILASVQTRVDVDSAWTDIETNVNNIILNNPLPQRVTEQSSYNIELLNGVFTEGKQNIKLVYKAGESDSSSYGEIRAVAIEMVVWRHKQSSQGNSLLGISTKSSSVSGANGNTTFLDMKREWKEVLNRYRVRI